MRHTEEKTGRRRQEERDREEREEKALKKLVDGRDKKSPTKGDPYNKRRQKETGKEEDSLLSFLLSSIAECKELKPRGFC